MHKSRITCDLRFRGEDCTAVDVQGVRCQTLKQPTSIGAAIFAQDQVRKVFHLVMCRVWSFDTNGKPARHVAWPKARVSWDTLPCACRVPQCLRQAKAKPALCNFGACCSLRDPFAGDPPSSAMAASRTREITPKPSGVAFQ